MRIMHKNKPRISDKKEGGNYHPWKNCLSVTIASTVALGVVAAGVIGVTKAGEAIGGGEESNEIEELYTGETGRYEVDTFFGPIATKCGISTSKLENLNPQVEDSSDIDIGDILTVPKRCDNITDEQENNTSSSDIDDGAIVEKSDDDTPEHAPATNSANILSAAVQFSLDGPHENRILVYSGPQSTNPEETV